MQRERTEPYRQWPFPFRGATQQNFEEALTASCRQFTSSRLTAESLRSVEDAVRCCVRELRDDGMLPEGVIITMRAYLRHTAVEHFLVTASQESHVALSILGDQVSTWSIDEYYSDPGHEQKQA